IIADMLTVLEAKGVLQGIKFVWVGDGNNVCNSWLLGAATTGMNMVVSCPRGYEPNKQILGEAKQLAQGSGGSVSFVQDPLKAVEGADVIYTDVWVSMGQDKEAKKKERGFKAYQINSKLVSKAKPNVAVMHCLPAHRGLEITDDVIEGPRSIVWKQGANKLYSAASVLEYCLK